MGGIAFAVEAQGLEEPWGAQDRAGRPRVQAAVGEQDPVQVFAAVRERKNTFK